MEVEKVVKEHVLKNIDENTARLVPEQYRATLFYFCGSNNEKARQDWLRESPLPEVTIVETRPMRQIARKLEKFAFKLKKTSPVDAANFKHMSDTTTLLCNLQYQAEINTMAIQQATVGKLEKFLQKVQLLDGPAMTAIVDNVNKEQEKVLAEFREKAIAVQDEEGASACQMTDKKWLLSYRNMNDAKIQTWIDLHVELSGIETGIPEAWKTLVMKTGGDRLWRVVNNANFAQS
ncbi:hypothetical protein LCI18_008806 [Fusarium solani-melongenae]|uniref:Uncharacterized protein n=1 Tax=Fusarium solani subsp. cucurbitae TaxID=2747967 RepID=A0ACD3Z9I7_FUSSC|nr:hypothetical protein LCI18_008806 [Fusarium solani-melongenae]